MFIISPKSGVPLNSPLAGNNWNGFRESFPKIILHLVLTKVLIYNILISRKLFRNISRGYAMPGVKTAISLEKGLFDQVNKLSKEMHVSRSRLFTLAVEDYLRRYESKKLLDEINSAYSDIPGKEERRITHAMKQKQRKNLEVESW
jgi:predicted DNA-binding ribbon-helix-helix protein